MSADKNIFNHYEDSSGQVITKGELGTATSSPDWSDTVKITSGCTGLSLYAARIYGGKEDCADLNNRASNCTITAEWHPQGRYLATIKGGCHAILLSGDVFGHGSEVDVDLGNWSDHRKNVTTGTILSLWSQTGKPIRVRVLNATVPTFVAGSGPYVFAFPEPNKWYHGIAVKIQQFLCSRGWWF